jgi:hypothetical protein
VHLPNCAQTLASVHVWLELLLQTPVVPAHWVAALATVHAWVFPE